MMSSSRLIIKGLLYSLFVVTTAASSCTTPKYPVPLQPVHRQEPQVNTGPDLPFTVKAEMCLITLLRAYDVIFLSCLWAFGVFNRQLTVQQNSQQINPFTWRYQHLFWRGILSMKNGVKTTTNPHLPAPSVCSKGSCAIEFSCSLWVHSPDWQPVCFKAAVNYFVDIQSLKDVCTTPDKCEGSQVHLPHCALQERAECEKP